jgi:hypothetical protein
MNPTRHILDLFNEQLIQFDHITHAWFTSFTLEPSFVERYILPPLFGLGTPKDYRDYAQLQSEITQSDAADVRFFVDSTVNADVWNQRSISFPVHPVFMSELEGFSDAGVFHPKVILIAGTIGEALQQLSEQDRQISPSQDGGEILKYLLSDALKLNSNGSRSRTFGRL